MASPMVIYGFIGGFVFLLFLIILVCLCCKIRRMDKKFTELQQKDIVSNPNIPLDSGTPKLAHIHHGQENSNSLTGLGLNSAARNNLQLVVTQSNTQTHDPHQPLPSLALTSILLA